jgi:tRNA (Thr-GGU) A37 N-methylase
MIDTSLMIKPIGVIRSDLASRAAAPHQGFKGAPDAWLAMNSTLEIAGNRLKVGLLEAIDGTPIVDIKPALPQSPDS